MRETISDRKQSSVIMLDVSWEMQSDCDDWMTPATDNGQLGNCTPHHLRFIGIQLKPIRSHPTGYAVRSLHTRQSWPWATYCDLRDQLTREWPAWPSPRPWHMSLSRLTVESWWVHDCLILSSAMICNLVVWCTATIRDDLRRNRGENGISCF